MRLLRIGMIFLVVGVSLLVATILRAKPIMMSGGYAPFPDVLGPFLLEPRKTTIVLKDVSPQNVTVAVVAAQSWRATQNISEVDPVFAASGMMKLDRLTFKVAVRGVYYIMVITNAGEFADEADLAVEQWGFAEDLLWISGVVLGVGVVMIVIDRVRLLSRHD